MTSLLLQFVFIVLLVILPMALYRSRRSFMAVFYRAMTDNAQARKFYTQVLVVLLLLFHYVYTTGHPGQFGTVLSAIVCAAMFSARRTDRWLRKLLDRPKAFVACGVFALAVCIVPQLFTLSATVSYILLAALFYPSAEFWPNGRTGTGDFTCRNIRMRCPTSTIAIITRGCHDNADRSGLILSAQ